MTPLYLASGFWHAFGPLITLAFGFSLGFLVARWGR